MRKPRTQENKHKRKQMKAISTKQHKASKRKQERGKQRNQTETNGAHKQNPCEMSMKTKPEKRSVNAPSVRYHLAHRT